MTKILHLDASPRKEGSFSRKVAAGFLEGYLAAHPGTSVDTLNVWDEALPDFDQAAIDAKYAVMGGKDFTPAQKAAWDRITAEADRFKSADIVLISTPMWNFGVPYRLKHYIDVISQPGLTFGWAPEKGFFGLVTGKKALVVTSSSGDYTPGTGAAAIDFETPYLEWILKFYGFEDITHLRAGALAGPDQAAIAARLDTLAGEARALASKF